MRKAETNVDELWSENEQLKWENDFLTTSQKITYAQVLLEESMRIGG